MKIKQIRWTQASGWEPVPEHTASSELVIVFADSPYFHTEACFKELRSRFPSAHIMGCSSSGTAAGTEIFEENIVATAVKFDHSRIRITSAQVATGQNIQEIGERLMDELKAPDLRHVFVLSDGLLVNGSELARGLNKAGLPVTGGLAGDGTRFSQTWVMADAPAQNGQIAALGLYGDVTVKSGCFAGWEEFGAERIVTKSKGNVVYEFDGQPALVLYKKYLGEQAVDLPSSGLRFPLSIQADKTDKPLIRTLLARDEATNSLTFAGDVPQGYICKLMRTNLDMLIENAGLAADAASSTGDHGENLCIVVSCVGRRLVMGQLTEEELEAVQDKLGAATTIAGFYSYGELAPFSEIMQCQLHNQTMTLTTIRE